MLILKQGSNVFSINNRAKKDHYDLSVLNTNIININRLIRDQYVSLNEHTQCVFYLFDPISSVIMSKHKKIT